KNLYDLIEGDESREVLRSPRIEALRKDQMERGRLGDKTGQGFYKKGGPSILTLDLETHEYRQRIEPDIPSIAEATKIGSLPERLQFVLGQNDKAGALARHVVYNLLAYAARRIPEISDDIVNVDRAMRWGFSHEMGPFELWDALGIRVTAEAMQKYGIDVPKWVLEKEHFHERAVVSQHVDDDVLYLQSIDTRDIVKAIEELERGAWIGMIISGEGADFCAAANNSDGFSAFQDALTRLRFCSN